MFRSFSTFTAITIVLLGLLGDPRTTCTSLTLIIALRGAAFLLRKISLSLSKDLSDILEFASWCLCVVPAISILKSAQIGIEPVFSFFTSLNDGVAKMTEVFTKIASFGKK